MKFGGYHVDKDPTTRAFRSIPKLTVFGRVPCRLADPMVKLGDGIAICERGFKKLNAARTSCAAVFVRSLSAVVPMDEEELVEPRGTLNLEAS